MAGRLALLWNKDVVVDLLSFSHNHIDVEVHSGDQSQQWRCTGFYGVADQASRYQSWDLLLQLASQNELPWIVGGDFNKILSSEENEAGLDRSDHLIQDFCLPLMDCALFDLSFEGVEFTWSNNREAPNTVRCRLDRVCTNSAWTALFRVPLLSIYSIRGEIMCLYYSICSDRLRSWERGGRDRGGLRLVGSDGRNAKELFEIAGESI